MLGRMETAWKACQGTAVPYKCPFNDSKSEKCEGERGEATLCEEREKGRLGNQRGDGIAKKHREAERQLTTKWEASLRGSETTVPRWWGGETHLEAQVCLERSQPW